jgi:hypothetical protein
MKSAPEAEEPATDAPQKSIRVVPAWILIIGLLVSGAAWLAYDLIPPLRARSRMHRIMLASARRGQPASTALAELRNAGWGVSPGLAEIYKGTTLYFVKVPRESRVTGWWNTISVWTSRQFGHKTPIFARHNATLYVETSGTIVRSLHDYGFPSSWYSFR